MKPNPNNPAFFFIFFFICLWLAVSLLISFIGGWYELSRVYEATRPFEGKRWRFQSARFRFGIRYNGALTLAANAEGIYLAVFFLFRVGHSPLFIPWQDISVRPVKFLWFPMERFEFRQVPSVSLRLYPRLARKVEAAAGAAWPGNRSTTGAASLKPSNK